MPAEQQRLDIIFVHPPAHRRTGGIFKAGVSYIEGLRAAGHHVEAWTASPAFAEEMRKLDVPTFYDRSLRSVGALLLAPRTLLSVVRRARGARAFIHNNGRLWLVGWLLGARRHFVVFHNESIGIRGFFRNWLSISDAQRARLLPEARRRPWVIGVQRIRNGLANPEAALPTGPASPGSDQGPPTIGFLAEIRPKKGLDVLLAAAAKLIERHVPFRLAIGGDGPDLAGEQAKARELGLAAVTTWHGWVSQPTHFYRSIDVFCLPSRIEPFGLVMIEAMACGIPVVATRTDGPNEVLPNSGAGILVGIDDAAALADALERLVKDTATRRAMGEAGRRYIQHHFAPRQIGEQIAQAITNCSVG